MITMNVTPAVSPVAAVLRTTPAQDWAPDRPGWFPDPWQPCLARYFDGASWTEHSTPAL